MSWLPAQQLVDEVCSPEDLDLARRAVLPYEISLLPEKEQKKRLKDFAELLQRAEILPHLIPTLKALKATWRYLNYGFQFKLAGNAILCWWPRTDTLLWQGTWQNAALYGEPKDIVQALTFYQQNQPALIIERPLAPIFPTATDATAKVLICLVCGGAPPEIAACIKCRREHDDLCSTCFLYAHHCLSKDKDNDSR